MSEFLDAVVLVTGAGRGIGRAIALAFARQGAILAVNDLTPVNLADTVAQIRSLDGRVKEYIFDIARQMPVEAMVAEILQDWGRIDILVNNAGVHPFTSLLDMDEWDLRRTLDVNLCGPFFLTQTAGRAMRAQGGGQIVNIAAAPVLSPASTDSAAFFASKLGLIGLTRAAAHELAQYNIRVNAVCPGWVETEAIAASPARIQAQTWLDQNPHSRLSQPDEVARLVLLLCSAAAGSLTGQALDLDCDPQNS
jgi:NAD(P)-dependent dehydrogenase (short-subunit alcohol dehydrogenase family)